MHDGVPVDLGRLEIRAGLDPIHARLTNRILLVLVTQAIKTFLVSGFILLLFDRLAGRRIRILGEWARQSGADQVTAPPSGRAAERPDELDEVTAALHLMRDELEQRVRDRTAELREFTRVASHDLKAPLRTVTSFSEILLSEEDGPLLPAQREHLERMLRTGRHMERLLADLLTFERADVEPIDLETVDLQALAESVLVDLDGMVRDAGAEVRVDSLPSVRGNPGQLRQVFQNLVGNALKFRDPGRPCRIELAGHVEDGLATVTCTDNGIGFEPKHAGRLHQRATRDGTGLGLAICARIMKRHGGSIRATGAPGEGASFTLEFPPNPQGEAIGLP